MTFADALVWIVSVLAIVGGLAAIVRPMAQQITTLLEAEQRHRETERQVASIEVRFHGIETQFRNLDERTLRVEAAFNEKLRAMDEKIQMEYKAAEQRLDGLAEVSKEDITHLRDDAVRMRTALQEQALVVARLRRGE